MNNLDEWGRGALSKIAGFFKGNTGSRPPFQASQADQGQSTSQSQEYSTTFGTQQAQSSDMLPEIEDFPQYYNDNLNNMN